MGSSGDSNVFAGSMPQVYEKYLVPLIFEPYAADLVQRLAARSPVRVLEVAAGTGVVTRAMVAALPARASIVATDLSRPMLDQAAAIGTQRPVEWRQADAMELPFPDGAFDAVVCQFGVMFFPERSQAFAEARRVLQPGGVFMFNAWDRLEDNEFADAVTAAVAAVFPDDPPTFLPRTPYSYHDHARIAQDLARGGFTSAPKFETVTARSRAAAARDAAIAYCQGTPLRAEIEARDGARLGDATDAAARVLSRRFGDGPVDGKIQASVVAIER